METELCEVCEEQKPKWSIHNEHKGIKYCRDCASVLRSLSKVNQRPYFEEVEHQIAHIKCRPIRTPLPAVFQGGKNDRHRISDIM